MKITSKLATAVAILGIGLGGAASVSQTQNQPKEVQAAAKRNTKPKKYKRVHMVLVNETDEDDYRASAGDGFYEPEPVNAYRYINGKKYLKPLASNKWFPASDMKAPQIYHVISKIKLLGLYFSDDGVNPDIGDESKTPAGLERYNDDNATTYWVKPGTGRSNTIAVYTNKVFNFYGEKYYAATQVTDNMTHYIKVSDMKKLAKGGNVKNTMFGYTKAQLKADCHRAGDDLFVKQFGYNPKKIIYGGISMK